MKKRVKTKNNKIKKVLIFITVLFMAIGYAGISTILDLAGRISIGFNFDDVNIYIANLYSNNINKFNSISEDKMEFNIELENGINNINVYIANNSTQYDEYISFQCNINELDGITMEDNETEENNNIVYSQMVKKKTIVFNNSKDNQTVNCRLINLEIETTIKANQTKKVIFAADGFENPTAFKIIDSLNYGELPELNIDNIEFLGWYNSNDELIESTTQIQSFSDEVLTAKFDVYLIKFINGNEEKEFSISKKSNETILKIDNLIGNIIYCNNSVIPSLDNNILTLKNITSDTICYSSNEISFNSSNYNSIYINGNLNLGTVTISKDTDIYLSSSTIDATFITSNNANLQIIGDENSNIERTGGTVLNSHGKSIVKLENLNIKSDGSFINPYEESKIIINNCNIRSTNTSNASTIWMRGGMSSVEIHNSYINGPYGIGGQGGNIHVFDSEIVGYTYNGIQINNGYSGNVIISNSKITGNVKGVYLSGTASQTCTIENDSILLGKGGVGFQYDSSSNTLYYNSGTIYGTQKSSSLGKVILPTNKTINQSTEIINGTSYIKQYLE